MTHILVTGVAGFIGSHLAERLVLDGHDVTGLDAFDTTLYDAARKERNVAALLAGPRFRLLRGDLLDAPLVAQLVRGAEVVVHLAALAGVRPSLLAPARYARTNVEGTISVLEACRDAGVARVVFASSSSVYGARGAAAAFREDDPCLTPARLVAAYGDAGELLCSTYRDLFGLGISCLRFFTVYGPRQRGDMAIHRFTRAIAAGQPVTLFDADSARDYTFIDDIIDGTVAAAREVRPGAFNIYNLGGTHTTGLGALVAMIGEALGRAPEIVRGARQPGDVPVTWADVSRAAADLGYAPKVPLRAGLARFVDWCRAENLL